MDKLTIKLLTTTVPENKVGVFFLGQAGFVFKTPSGVLAAVDPYLSDCCNRYFGFKRLMPYVLSPDDIIFQQLIITHAHFDHFDPDSVPRLMANGQTHLIGAMDTKAECERLGVKGNITYIKEGDIVEADGICVEAVACDHGPDTPDAIGLLITISGKRIYIMGDTAYRPDYLENEKLMGVDLLILPINGAFGNLNEAQAADVLSKLKPKLAVPCHYWNFAEHGGNPALFCKAVSEIAPDIPYIMMRQGEDITI
jgi:L-ascorbate 6-phosphate lactonase